MGMVSRLEYERWLQVVYGRIAHNFTRAEPRQRAWNYLVDLPKAHSAGLRAGDSVGHYEGEQRADGVQRLLTSARWDETSIRDELRAVAIEAGGRTGGTLFITEVTFPKKGRSAAAVERQYSSETQKAENCQLGLALFYITARGQGFLLDFELYLPRTWAADTERRHRAQVPEDVSYRSRSSIAALMFERAWQGMLRPAWVACSTTCTDKSVLRAALHARRVPHILTSTAGESPTEDTSRAGALPPDIDLPEQRRFPQSDELAYRSTVLRRVTPPCASGRTPTSYLTVSPPGGGAKPRAYFTACTFATPDLVQLAGVVGLIEAAPAHCRAAKEEIGLGHYEVRSWRGWYRHMTLAAVAHTALQLARQHASDAAPARGPSAPGRGPLHPHAVP